MKNNLIINAALSLTFIVSTAAFADTTSVGNMKNQWQQQQALAAIQQLKNSETSIINKDKIAKTRQEILALKQQGKLLEKNKKQISPSPTFSTLKIAKPNAHQSIYHQFNIYQGYSQLIEDFDQDGYYQTFSVTFDADVITTDTHDSAVVYAELYLSKDGGDWIHYYTTDDFIIYGESEDDEYEVYTTLNQGYIPGNYDVLIDLYEAGYSDIVATYSSDNSNELYALPLESSDYDIEYVEHHSHSHGHGGSNSVTALLLLTLALVTRKLLAVRHN